MAIVLVPALMRDLCGGRTSVVAPGTTVRQVIENLEKTYPGFRARLLEGDDISPYIAVVVDGLTSSLRLLQSVEENSEIQFLPAIQGG